MSNNLVFQIHLPVYFIDEPDIVMVTFIGNRHDNYFLINNLQSLLVIYLIDIGT